ncbi:transporter substrate-binding domain-containing protein [Mycoplasmatota bacterium]|nr:transporter substrate-binding domain-containing protein [Mycoplasmatota bacterium]
MKKTIIISLIITLLTGCKANTETITVLTSTGYEPYEMVDTNGELSGFDIELFEALAQETGYEIKWKDVSFDGIIAALQANQADAAIAGITPSNSRKEKVDFSNTYYNSEDGLINYLIVMNDSSITGVSDLEAKVLGAQLGTIQADLVEEIKSIYNFETDLRNINAQIIQELKSGRIDALVVESAVADSILDSENTFKKVLLEVSSESITGNAIAFPKDSNLTQDFNNALETLKSNGKLKELVDKWFN